MRTPGGPAAAPFPATVAAGARPGAVHVPEPDLDRALHQLGDVDLLEEDVDRAGVGPRHLEQVADHALEAVEVVAEQLQRPLRARREPVAVGLEHLQGCRQGGQRRAQLVADVGVEPGLPLDPLLQLVHHRVERVRQPLEVRVGRVGVEAGVELTARDGPGGPRDVGQRSQGAHAGEAAERDAEDRRDHAGDEEGQPEHAERVVEVREVEHLEVGGLHRGDRHAHDDLGRALAGAVGLAWLRSPPGRPCAAGTGIEAAVTEREES